MVGKLLLDIESSKVKQCIPDLAKWVDRLKDKIDMSQHNKPFWN